MRGVGKGRERRYSLSICGLRRLPISDMRSPFWIKLREMVVVVVVV